MAHTKEIVTLSFIIVSAILQIVGFVIIGKFVFSADADERKVMISPAGVGFAKFILIFNWISVFGVLIYFLSKMCSYGNECIHFVISNTVTIALTIELIGMLYLTISIWNAKRVGDYYVFPSSSVDRIMMYISYFGMIVSAVFSNIYIIKNFNKYNFSSSKKKKISSFSIKKESDDSPFKRYGIKRESDDNIFARRRLPDLE